MGGPGPDRRPLKRKQVGKVRFGCLSHFNGTCDSIEADLTIASATHVEVLHTLKPTMGARSMVLARLDAPNPH